MHFSALDGFVHECVRQPPPLILAKKPRGIGSLCKRALKGGLLGEASRKDPFCYEGSPITLFCFHEQFCESRKEGCKVAALGMEI